MRVKFFTLIINIIFIINFHLYSIEYFQQRIIKGKITSASDGSPLPGATVIEIDENNRIISATVTDLNGNYIIKIQDPKNKLVVSCLGFESQTFSISNHTLLNVSLKEQIQEINEVVVKGEKKLTDGTFTISQKQISTAIQSIDTKSLEGIQVTSIEDAIQGRIAGFDIVANSGDLGAGSSMRIRGATSINANTQPLIVVNGVPYEIEVDPSFDFATATQEQYANMLTINPSDIEEITVLKDAAATAIWGSKGANGVLMIKTKKGAMGKTKVQYTYRLTGSVQPPGLKMLNGDDYTMLMKQELFNPHQDENAANIREFLYDPTYSEYENFNNNTDWVKAVIQKGYSHDHYLTVSGGGEKAMFRVSGGFLNQTGTVIGQRLNRFSTRASLDYNVSDRIKFITELSYTYTDNYRNWRAEKSSNRNDPDELSILAIAYRKMPNVSIYKQDIYGNNTNIFYNIPRTSSLHPDQRDLRNPVALALLAKDNLKNYRIIPTFRLQYDLLDPEYQMLRFSMYVSFDVNNDKVSKFLPHEVSNSYWNETNVNRASTWDSENMTVMTDNNITWQPKFKNKNHDLMLYGSFQLRTGNSSSMGIETTNLPSSELIDATSEGYLNGFSSSRFSYRSNAFLFRAHYVFKERYIFGLTFRRDGSTKFGKENKYGNFPGLSAKWIISDEPFMKWASKWLSMFAIRPSWGISGNQPRDEYLHYSRYSTYGSYIDMPATRPTTLRLSSLKWETTTSFNLGIDLGLFDNTIFCDMNFYHKRTEDLLFENLRIPSSSGYTTIPIDNVGTMDNDGWELNFNTNNLIKINDFKLDVNFNLSNYINTIVNLRDDVLAGYNADFNYTNGTYLTRIQEGNAFGSIYGFRYKGVYQYSKYIPGIQENAPVARDQYGNVIFDEEGKPLPMYFAYGTNNEYIFQGGDAIYEDINHDGSIDELDIVYLGNSNPKINGGFGSTIKYKGFSCTMFFNFRYGNKIINAARMYAENMYTMNNQSVAVNWRWRKDGDITNMPRALYNYGYNWLGSDRFVEDGSFLRFKYLTFNYSISKVKLSKLNLQQFNIYLTINNLYVWTKYTGVDPEIGYDSRGLSIDYANTPRPREYTLGISVTF